MNTSVLPQHTDSDAGSLKTRDSGFQAAFSGFSRRLTEWQRQHGRRNLPWQCRDPYRIWLSEIMLQQTRVQTVLDYYPRFQAAFPDVAALAAADEDSVLALWAGLGYYSRARNLHRAARQIVGEFGGRFPEKREELEKLCGVGRSTAAAVAAFAFQRREAILDGNVKRVLCRVFALDGDPSDKAFERRLWALAESLLPEQNDEMPAYTQGLMDLGATVCTRSRPQCGACPMAAVCLAKAQGQTDKLPRRKKTAAVQTVPLYWLLLRRADGAVWLEKRPARGIWAGLYCLPCFENLAALQDFAAAAGVGESGLRELPAFTRRLTHRLLEIMPFAAETQRQPENPASGSGLWVPSEQLSAFALPKPLDTLLTHKNCG